MSGYNNYPVAKAGNSYNCIHLQPRNDFMYVLVLFTAGTTMRIESTMIIMIMTTMTERYSAKLEFYNSIIPPRLKIELHGFEGFDGHHGHLFESLCVG